MWAAGIAAGAALVVWWQVVGPGYARLTGGVVVLIGVPAALAGGGSPAWAGTALAAAFAASAPHRRAASSLGALAAACFGLSAGFEGHPVAAVTGAAFLGGVTVEMLLGHWYLVDPTLPRWALRRLVAVGIAGAVADVVVLILLGVFPWASGDAPVGIGFTVLAAASLLLMLAVVGSLREEGYTGVMAATGLAYLALLTAIGAVVVGRLVLDGPVLS